MSYHKLIIVGNLGNDPEMRYTPSGQGVTNFSVASNRAFTDSNGQSVKETVWFRISVWGKQAESCNQYLTKGKMVLIEGELRPDRDTGRPRIWTTKDGKPSASYDVYARNVRFLSAKGAEVEPEFGEMEGGELGEEDIPF